VPADADPKSYQSKEADPDIQSSAALSMENTVKNTIKSRQIAILAADGVIDESIHTMKTALENEGAMAKIVSVRLGNIKTVNGKTMKVDESFLTTSSVLFDAVFIPSGKKSVSKLMEKLEAIEFIAGAYNHCKAIAADVHGTELLMKVDHLAQKGQKEKYGGILIDAEPEDFVNAIAQHRFWGREMVREKK
jgi:catalase